MNALNSFRSFLACSRIFVTIFNNCCVGIWGHYLALLALSDQFWLFLTSASGFCCLIYFCDLSQQLFCSVLMLFIQLEKLLIAILRQQKGPFIHKNLKILKLQHTSLSGSLRWTSILYETSSTLVTSILVSCSISQRF